MMLTAAMPSHRALVRIWLSQKLVKIWGASAHTSSSAPTAIHRRVRPRFTRGRFVVVMPTSPVVELLMPADERPRLAGKRDEAGQQDTGKANHHREQPGHNMSRRQIAVTDGEAGDKGEIKGVIDPPSLYAPDQKSGPDHCEKNPRQDWPDHAKQAKELYEEDAPDLPGSH